MAQQQQIREALDRVRKFIDSLITAERVAGADDASRWFEPGSEIGLWFWQEDEGTLYLTKPEAKRYRSTLGALVEAARRQAEISPGAVEAAFRQAILVALDLQDRRSSNLDIRLRNAIDGLHGSLTALSQTFRVYHRVLSLASDGLPTTVGKVEFVVFDNEQVERFRAAVGEHKVSEEQRERRFRQLEKLQEEGDITGCTVGVVEVSAVDSGAAEALAVWELHRTLDVINFYSDLVPDNHAFLSLPGDRGPARKTVPQIIVAGKKMFSLSVNRTRVGPVGELSLAKLRTADAARKYGFGRAAELLATHGSALQEQIVTSIQWAGRATADRWGGSRSEEVFLLYAIALESLILADHDTAELTYRLRLRVAHLLGSDTASRRELFEIVGHLYRIRSKLVHNGCYQVTDADISLVREITKAALLRVCTEDAFWTMSTPKELGKWFEDRALDG